MEGTRNSRNKSSLRHKAKKGVPKRLDKPIIYLLLLVVLGIIICATFYTGIYWRFDDSKYVLFASEIGKGTFNPLANPYSYGWAFPYFVLLSGYVFGFTSFGFSALTAVEYISLIILTYVLGTKLFKNRYIALLGAFIVCITPFAIQYSSRVLSDMLMGVIATLALIFFLSDRKRDWMLSGIMASILICIKLDGLAFILFFALYALFSKEKRKYVIGAIILGIVVYIIPSILIAHNPLYTFENYGNYQASINSISAERNGLVFLVMLGLAVIQKGLSPTSYYQIYSLGIMLWLAILSTAFLIKHRRKELYLIAFLFWGFLAYMLFGTITLSHYSVEAFIPRYLIIVAAPFALLISYLIAGIYHTIKNRSNRYIAAAIFIFIILLLLLSLLSTYIIIYQYEMMIVQQTVPSNIPLP